MFGKRNYYALVAGLREYALDGDNKGFDIEAILAEVKECVSRRDWQSVEQLYVAFDCENLIARRNGSSSHNRLGTLTAEQVGNELKSPSLMQKSVGKVLRAYAQPEGEDAEAIDITQPFARALMEAYFSDCANDGSRFIREWSAFDRTLRNVIAATTARCRGVAIDSVVVGSDDTTEQIRRSSASDFGLRGELAWVESVVGAINDETNLLERERRIDAIRWAEASAMTEFDYFNIEAVLCYLVKANIVSRWTALDPAEGRRLFDELCNELGSKGRDLINKL